MSSAAGALFGDLSSPSSPKWKQEEARKTLRPYRVKYGDRLYSQEDYTLDTEHRYHNFTSGVGAGKTVSGIMRLAANVQQWNPGEMGMIITPTTLGLKNVILPELSKWGFLQNWEYRGPQSEEPGLHAPNGARILLESADNDRKIERLRGPSIAWFWMDEAALVPEKAWDILIGRLRTGNYRNAFITTTPKGFNWVYEKFHPQSDNSLDDVNNVLGVPSFANPHLPLEYRRDILGEYEGEFYNQEVLGEFTQFEGLVYPWFDSQDAGTHVVEDLPSDRAIRRVFYGVDWGHNNPAVILAIAETAEHVVVLDEFYESRCTVTDLATVAQRLQERHRPGTVFCDPAEPASIEAFQRAGLDAVGADNEVMPGIQTISSLQDELRVHRSCQNLINEFGMYRYPDDGVDENPVPVNDHALDALRYALHTDERRGSINAGVAFG